MTKNERTVAGGASATTKPREKKTPERVVGEPRVFKNKTVSAARPDIDFTPLLEAAPEAAALEAVGKACDGTADPVYEIGPIAATIVGPISGEPPDWHSLVTFRDDSRRLHTAPGLNAFIRHCAGLGVRDAIRPVPDLAPPSDLLTVIPKLSDGAVSRPLRNDMRTGVALEAAMKSASPDTAAPVLDGRLAAYLALADRARGISGGEVADDVRTALTTLAGCLVGRARWSIRKNWEAQDFPLAWRHGANAMRVNGFLAADAVHDAFLRRAIEGPAPASDGERDV